MFHRWRSKLETARFYRQTAQIMKTAPMPVVDAPWSIVSMVSDSYVQMYILAMKSFYRRAGKGKIVVIIDGQMSSQGRQTLEHHLPGIRFTMMEDIDTKKCQRGGTWERLLYLLDHSKDEYAIQLDADTLTFGADVDEVVHCAENNIPFVLSNAGRPIEKMPAIAPNARAMDSNYIGIVAERLFDQYPGGADLNYVRASSAFVGFARGAIGRDAIEDFHGKMEKLLGSRWTEWGTEQSASNFAVANSPGAMVLPYPKYANFWEGLKRGNSSFLHFIGSSRYLDDYYPKRAREVIAELHKGESSKSA